MRPSHIVSLLSVFTLSLLISGCASVASLPQSAEEANFSTADEGRTGWSKYEEVYFLKGVDRRTAYLAAKEGLATAGFTIKKANYEKGMAIGEHGMTAYDWNVVAGVYMREEKKGTSVKVHVQGSKDVGFLGDMTADSWPQKIFKGMKEYILTESLIEDANKKHFE